MKKIFCILALSFLFTSVKLAADEVVADQEEVEQTEAVTEQEEIAAFTSWAQACQDHPYITGGAMGGSSLLVAALIYALKYYLWKQAEVEAEIEKKRDESAAKTGKQVAEDAEPAAEGDMLPFYQPCLDYPLMIGGTATGVTALIAAIVYLLKQYLAEQIEDGVVEQAGEATEEAKTRARKDAEKLKCALGVSDVQQCPFLGLCVELMGAFGDECPYLKVHPEVLEKRDAKKCPFLAACKK